MEQCMLERGRTAKLMDKAGFFMLMVTSTRVTGQITKLMELEPIFKTMLFNTRVSGKMI